MTLAIRLVRILEAMGEQLSNDTAVTLVVKWSSNEYVIDCLDPDNSVGDVKFRISTMTGVRPERQKLMLKTKNGKSVNDDTKIGQLLIRPGLKIMMIGSKEEQIANIGKCVCFC